MAKQEDTKNFGAFIDRTHKIIRSRYIQAFKEKGIDLTTEQWVLMDLLAQQNGISQNELANGTFKNAPTVSRIIDLLCKKGLTERQRFENDRRRYKIFLTPLGKITYKKAHPIVLKLREQGWDNLSDKDYKDFLRIINKVFQNFENRS